MEGVIRSRNIMIFLRLFTGMILILSLMEMIPFLIGSLLVIIFAVISIGHVVAVCIKKKTWEHSVEVTSHLLFILIILLSAKNFQFF